MHNKGLFIFRIVFIIIVTLAFLAEVIYSKYIHILYYLIPFLLAIVLATVVQTKVKDNYGMLFLKYFLSAIYFISMFLLNLFLIEWTTYNAFTLPALYVNNISIVIITILTIIEWILMSKSTSIQKINRESYI